MKKLLILLAIFAAGCSQSVNEVSVTPKNPVGPQPEVYISTTDVQGATTTPPVSATRRLLLHSLGGTNVRTSSTSANFRMTSGVSVD